MGLSQKNYKTCCYEGFSHVRVEVSCLNRRTMWNQAATATCADNQLTMTYMAYHRARRWRHAATGSATNAGSATWRKRSNLEICLFTVR